MPIPVVCPSCGKKLKVPDAWAGKRGKCPQCMGTFPIAAEAAAAPVVSAPLPPATAAERAAAKLKTRGVVDRSDHSTVSISWGPILLAGLGLLVLGTILAVVFGPVRMQSRWKTMDVQARSDAIDVVDFGLKAFMSTEGYWDATKGSPPTVSDVQFFFSPFSFSFPEKVPFRGSSSEGGFEGFFHPADRTVDADIQLGGASLGGLGVVREGNTKFSITGKSDGRNVNATINGKKASIYIRPRLPDEELD